MGLFSFIKEAGEKLFGGKEVEAAVVSASSNPAAKPSLDELNAKASRAIETYIGTQNLGVEAVQVAFDGTTGTVTVLDDLTNYGFFLGAGFGLRRAGLGDPALRCLVVVLDDAKNRTIEIIDSPTRTSG